MTGRPLNEGSPIWRPDRPPRTNVGTFSHFRRTGAAYAAFRQANAGVHVLYATKQTSEAPTSRREASAREAAGEAAPSHAPAPAQKLAPDALGRRLAHAVLQRKSLAVLKWLPKLNSTGSRELVGDVKRRKGVVYAKPTPEPAAGDKLAALQLAATRNAEVGDAVDQKAWASWADVHGWEVGSDWRNDKWTRSERDDQRVDPFFFEVTVPYGPGKKKPTLKLRFQHAKNYTGYVESVYDSGNAAATGYPSMYDFETESKLKDTTSGRNLRYSNKHDTVSSKKVLDQTYGSTEESFDAYTKIAGEGARWRCVRKHAGNLQNHSRFYVRYADGMYGVTFVSLWLNWERVFDKRYNISDREVAAKIHDGAFGDQAFWLDWADEQDYLLEDRSK